MSFTLMCCNNCGRVGKHTLLCEDCDGVAYCSLKCRVADTLCHEQYCEAYRKRRISKDKALADAKTDINALFSHKMFSYFINALHEVWDPFCTGHITCTIMRKEYTAAQYISCQIQFTSGLTSINKSKRVVKARYIHTGASRTLPVIYTMNVTYDTRYGPHAYCALCGDRILDVYPDSTIIVNMIPTTGDCVLIVDGRHYVLQ